MNFITIILLVSSFGLFAQESLLSDSIPYPFYEVQKAEDGQENNLTILNSGIGSFEKRIEMIRSAKKTLELEYFIFDKDISGKLMLQELVKAGDRGVKVRILVDKSVAVVKLDDYDAQVLNSHNVELRFYNTAPLIRLNAIQFRNHRKIIIADSQYAIVGGRNIADDYFDMDHEYNFHDRDVYIDGPIVKTIEATFNIYFDQEVTKKASFPGDMAKREKSFDQKILNTNELFQQSEEDKRTLQNLRVIGKKALEKNVSRLCPELTWSTDRPVGKMESRSGDIYSDDYRYLRKTIYDKMVAVNKKVTISSPYIMNNEYSRDLMYKMLDKGVGVEVYTNSLSSTDAVYVAANLYKDVYNWRRKGIITNLHQGNSIGEVLVKGTENARWGTHSKTYLFEDSDYNEFMISTYNVDNRSNHYNSELGLFCKGNDLLFRDVSDSVRQRIKHGMEIKADKTAVDNSTGETVNRFGKHPGGLTMMRLISLPAWLFKFLL